MKPTSDILDTTNWKNLDGARLDEILTGCTITGAEPIDYPLTDGFILYLRNAEGQEMALNVDGDPTEPEEYFTMQLARYNDKSTGAAAKKRTART